MSIFSKILAMITNTTHEQRQEQRIQYLETELQQTKNDLQEIQNLMGLLNCNIEEVEAQSRSNKNAVRNVQRRLKNVTDKQSKKRQSS